MVRNRCLRDDGCGVCCGLVSEVKTNRAPKDAGMNWKARILISFSVTLAIAAMVLYAGYIQLGKTPDQYLAYCERRLEGHPKLEAVMLPFIHWARRHVR
jgi:hypothetical protein